MAKTEAAEGATPDKKEGAAGKRKKTFKKRGEKRIVHHGLAHVQASFNNTVVTITDTEGNVVECRRHRLQGLAEGDAIRGNPGRPQCRQRGEGGRHAVARRAREGPGLRA